MCILIVELVVDTYVQPHTRLVQEYQDGPTISHPVVKETVGTGLLFFLAWVMPWIAIWAACLPKFDAVLFYR